MRKAIMTAMLLASCKSQTDKVAPTAPPTTKGTTALAIDNDAPKGEIFTDRVNEMNSAKYGRPTSEFRKGSVTPIPPPKATKTATGFQVQFASHASMVTPTVHERRVLVSGGFKSKELYAYSVETGQPLWGIDLHDDGPSSPACERGTCVISTESCTLFAIDSATGKQLWSYWLGDPLTSAPTIAGNRVFASYPAGGTADGKEKPANATHALAAFDLSTGAILWQMWLEGDVMSAPVAVGEFVYVTTFGGTVIKLEQATGKVRYAMKAKATSAPVVQFDQAGVEQMYYTRRGEDDDEAKNGASEMIIRADHNEPQTKYKAAKKSATYVDKQVQSKSAHAGKAKSEDESNGFGSTPQAAASSYAADSVGVQSVSSMQGFQGSRIVKVGGRNVNTMGDEVLATDVETGQTLWSYKLTGIEQNAGGAFGTAPLAAGNSIMFGTLAGEVVRLETSSGKKTSTYAVGAPVRSQPVVHDGWIYVGTDDGKLVAIDTKDKSITGWTTWGGNAQRTGIYR